MEPVVDVVVVGAGLAGLSCARALVDQGRSVVVVDRSPRLGGRCATRAPGDGAPLADFGPVFVHGDDPDFLSFVTGSGLVLDEGWPRRVVGTGTPCQPQAFDPRQRRFAVAGGLRSLAEVLGLGLPLVPETTVVGLDWNPDRLVALTDDGRSFAGRDLVVALAPGQARALVEPLDRSLGALLGTFAALPCLTVTAVYPPGTPEPPVDVWYPEASRALLMVSNETAKRGPGAPVTLTIQARPGWSANRVEGDRDDWARALLTEAATLVGPWAALPSVYRAHRWKEARLAPSDHLVRPVVAPRPGSWARLALAGDLFDPDGGLQGAWKSGRAVAARLVETPPLA